MQCRGGAGNRLKCFSGASINFNWVDLALACLSVLSDVLRVLFCSLDFFSYMSI